MINAGTQSSVLADSLGKYLPPGGRQLDMVFLPVSDKQAIRSIRHGCSGVTIHELVWLGNPSGHTTAGDLEEYLSVQEISNTTDAIKLEFSLSSGASLILHPIPDNGGIFILQWNNFKMLIPIGIDRSDWINEILVLDPLSSYTIVMLAGDGSIDLNPAPMINKLEPSIIIINSKSDQPPAATPIIDQDGTILTTDQNGWIHISTDGEQLWVEAARNPE